MSVVEAISQFVGALAPIMKEATLSKIVSGEIGSSKIESPARHYDKPQEVVHDDALTDGQKKKALDSWEADAEALQRADDEGMTGGEPSKLTDVVDAKKELNKKP